MQDTDSKPGLVQLVTSYPARLVAYGFVTLLVFQLVYVLIQVRGAKWLAVENGALEVMQVACSLLAVAAIAVALRWTPVGRAPLVTAAGLILYAAARESDLVFETLFFDDAYKWLVGLPVALVVVTVIYRERDKIIAETLYLAEKPGATLFAIGGIYLCFFCQMTDRPLFWSPSEQGAVMGDQKALVEESAELFAYLLLVFSGVEVMIAARRDQRIAQRNRELEIPTANAGPLRISVNSRRAA